MSRSVEYVPRTQFETPTSVEYVREPPTNGNTFRNNTSKNVIEFRIRGDSFLDPSQTKLSCTVKAVPFEGEADYNVFSTGSFLNAIDDLEIITPGGGVLEHVNYHGRSFQALSLLSSNVQQCSCASATDTYDDIAPSTSTYTGGRCTGRKLNTPAGKPPADIKAQNVCVSLELSSVLGPSCDKFIPLCFLDGDLIVRITLAREWQHCYSAYEATRLGDNAGADMTSASYFEVTDPALLLSHVRYSPEAYDRIKRSILDEPDATVSWDAVQTVSSLSTIGYSSRESVLFGSTSYRDVKQLVVQRFIQPNHASYLFTMLLGNGCFSGTISVDGEYVRGTPISSDITSNLLCNVAPFAMEAGSASRNCTDVHDSNTQLVYQVRETKLTGQCGGFSNLNAGETYTSNVGPSTAPTQSAAESAQYGQDGKALDPPFWLECYDLREVSGNTGHLVRGRDCTGRQLVYHALQENSIPTATTPAHILLTMSIGVKMHLRLRSDGRGSLTCQRD